MYSQLVIEALSYQQEKQRVSPKQFQLIESGEGFHHQLRHDIENAQKSIDMQFFIFEGDEKGVPLMQMLEKAARKGIQVRVVVDHEDLIHHPINTWAHVRYLKSLCRQGLPLEVQFPKINKHSILHRDHKKNVVIDGDSQENGIAYLGGRNISQRDSKQHDFMIRINGTLVTAAKDDFTRTWNNKNTTKTIYINEGNNILLSDTPETKGVDESVKSLMARAEKRIWIQTPYYGRKTLNPTLAKLKSLRPELDIRVIMPNPALNNHFIYNVLTRLASHELGKSNIDVYWYENIFNHAKAMLIDDIAVVGSSNFNQGIITGQDDELELISPDTTFVKDLELLFERSFHNSTYRRRSQSSAVKKELLIA